MKPTLKYMFAEFATALLTACGGGGDSASGPTLYGSIAIDRGRLETGIAAGYTNQADADLMAKQNCGFPTCEVVKQYTGPGVCAVTAWSVGGVTSYGIGATKAIAETNAIRSCTEGGGRYCELAKYLCM